MDFELFRHTLMKDAELIMWLTEEMPEGQARWKPDPETWSVLEVINHLADEEVEDFRALLDLILHAPARPLPSIDPMGWVTARDYNARALTPSVQRFMSERQRSLAWLRELDAPDWEAAVQMSHGEMRAGDVVASWVAHDQWHIQQLVQIRRAYLAERAKPYRTAYAGTL
jgi:hypothetical protein